MNELALRLNAALPQTQCTRCGYPDCAAYAQAMANGEARINQCPPGGMEGIRRLAALTGQPVEPLNPANGVEGPLTVAVIDEDWCIGCTLCIKACPTDAIVGTHKRVHTVIEPYCTGCELCIPACPVDCISLDIVSPEGRTGWDAWTPAQAQQAQQRYETRQRRLIREKQEHDAALEAKAQMKRADLAADSDSLHTDRVMLERKRNLIESILARARARHERHAAEHPTADPTDS